MGCQSSSNNRNQSIKKKNNYRGLFKEKVTEDVHKRSQVSWFHQVIPLLCIWYPKSNILLLDIWFNSYLYELSQGGRFSISNSYAFFTLTNTYFYCLGKIDAEGVCHVPLWNNRLIVPGFKGFSMFDLGYYYQLNPSKNILNCRL